MDNPDSDKKQIEEQETGRFTAQLNGLQLRLENYTEKTPWASAWKARLNRLYDLKIGTSAAASTFYLLFSIFPLIIFIFSLLELMDIGLAERFASAIPKLSVAIPEEILYVLRDFLDAVSRTTSIPFLSLSILGLLWASSRGAGNTVASLNRIYHREERYNFLLLRLVGILAIFVISLLLIAVLLVLAFNRFLIDYLKEFISLPDFLLQNDFNILAHLVTWVFLTFIFAIIFTLLKRKRSYFRHTLYASMATAAAWLIISYGLSHFIAIQTRYYFMYGSIAGIIFLMLWLYLAVYIIMGGAFFHAEMILKYPKPPRKSRRKKAADEDVTP